MYMQARYVMTVGVVVLMSFSAQAVEDGPLTVAPDIEEGTQKKAERPMDMFEDADVDGDGFLTETEFLGRAKQHFKAMDMDGDGLVSPDEMLAKNTKRRLKLKQHLKERKKQESAEK